MYDPHIENRSNGMFEEKRKKRLLELYTSCAEVVNV
jgi:hypothetical protein